MGKKDEAKQDQSFAATAAPSTASSVLGPLDVQQKEFRVARFGGYKMRDVDEFLDRITDSMSALTTENARLRTGAPASIVGTPDLADVSRQADEIIARARAEAARIVAEAKTASGGASGPASPQERAAVTAFLTREREFLQSLAGLVQEHAEQVRGMAKTSKRAPARPLDQPKASQAKESQAKTTEAKAAPAPPPPAAAASAAPATSKEPSAPPTPVAAEAPTPAEPPPTEPRSEPTVRIDDPEPASVGRSEAEGETPAEGDRSLRDLFWGED